MPFSKSRLVAKWLNSVYRDTETEEVESTHLDNVGGGGLPIQITTPSVGGVFQETSVLTADDTSNAESTKLYHPVFRYNYMAQGLNTPALETHLTGIRVYGKGTGFGLTSSDGVFAKGIGFDGRDGTNGIIRQDHGITGKPSIISNWRSTTANDEVYADMSHMRSHTPMAYNIQYNELHGNYPVNLVYMAYFSTHLNLTLSQLKRGQEVLYTFVCDGKLIFWPSGIRWLNNGGNPPVTASGQNLSVVILKTSTTPAYDAWVLGNG